MQLIDLLHFSTSLNVRSNVFFKRPIISCVLTAVLQSVDEPSCRGLKHLLLGSILKCQGNIRDAVQVGLYSDERIIMELI